MNAHAHTHSWRLDTRPGPSTGYVPAVVGAALERWQTDYTRAAGMPHRTDTEHAARAERLAVLADRAARWWDVLARWVSSPAGRPLPTVFGYAALGRAHSQRDSARFWRETAADWRARAEGRPTSDAAGALSNHQQLGIAS